MLLHAGRHAPFFEELQILASNSCGGWQLTGAEDDGRDQRAIFIEEVVLDQELTDFAAAANEGIFFPSRPGFSTSALEFSLNLWQA